MDTTPSSIAVKKAQWLVGVLAMKGVTKGSSSMQLKLAAEMDVAQTLYKEAIAADKLAREKADRILAERKAAEEEAARKNSARLLACREKADRILAERKAAREEAARILAERKALEKNTRILADIEWVKQFTKATGYW
jgi:predicted TIM-barrel enzyme